MIHTLNIIDPEDEGKFSSDIRQRVRVEPVITSTRTVMANSPAEGRYTSNRAVLGLTVKYTDSDAVRAQKICNALAALVVDENVRLRPVIDVTDFLDRQLNLANDDLEHKRAELLAIRNSPSPHRPKEEAAQKALEIDYANAQALYKSLRAKKSESELLTGGVSEPPLGKYVHVIAADVPQTPSSPKRLLFSVGGLGVGFLLGIGRVLWLPLRNASGV
jgi:uncharacterized protein involved in exopolysaccharide biosynthesis